MIKDIKNLIKEKESEDLEFKSSLSELKEIIQTICAFANKNGGKIIIGVSPSGEILGVQVGKNTIEKLTNQILTSLEPKIYPKIQTEKIKNKIVIVIEIPEIKEKPVLAFGRPYKRMGKSTVKISKGEYERLILEKHKDKLQFDNQICLKATIKEIDKKKLRWFLRKAKEERNYDIEPETPIKEALNRLNLIQDGKLTNTAILLFAKG